MKTVHKADMVAHLWANQSQAGARTSTGNFSFAGADLRSYSTVIARIFSFGVVIADHNYSATTNKHQALARRACSHLVRYALDSVDDARNAADVASHAIDDAETACETAATKRPGYGPHAEAIRKRNSRLALARAAIAAIDDKATRRALEKRMPQADGIDAWSTSIRTRRAATELESLTVEYRAELSRLADYMGDTDDTRAEWDNPADKANGSIVRLQRLAYDAKRAAEIAHKRLPAVFRAALPVTAVTARYDAWRARQHAAEIRAAMIDVYRERRGGRSWKGCNWYASRVTTTDSAMLALQARVTRGMQWDAAPDHATYARDYILEALNPTNRTAERIKLAASARRELANIPMQWRGRAELAAEIDALPIAEWKAALMAEHAARVDRWRAGENIGGLYDLPIMLRVKGDIVETSHGAYVSIPAARIVWREIVGAAGTDRTYEPAIGVGNFRLSQIRADGGAVIGCHDIPGAELRACASTLGFVS